MSILLWTWILTGLSFAVYIYIAYCGESEDDRRLLCRREVGSGLHERHGHRRRLDVGGVVHFHGRPDLLSRARRLVLPDGVDRRLRAAGHAVRPLPAQVRQVHDPPVHRRPLLLRYRSRHRAGLRHLRVLHLCGGPDARRRRGLLALHGRRHQHRRDHRHGAGLLLRHPGRNEGHHLHPGGAVRRPHHRLSDPGHLRLHAVHRQSVPAVGHGLGDQPPKARRC